MHEQLTPIEMLCKQQVEKDFGRELWAAYEVARAKVFDEMLPYIRQSEPFLTDHSPEHITNVLNNAFQLLGKERCIGKESTNSLEAAELYLLVLSILFHDVGNVFSRKGHKSRLQEAYAFARGSGQSLLQEKLLLVRIVEAHGGETLKGSPDTIGPLDREGIFKSKRVDCQRVAAILRLADEIAEGPQRTSLFMQTYLPYQKDAQVFHDYATIFDIHIDRGQGRLAIVYHIEIAPDTWGPGYDSSRIRALLQFCYRRLQKLDLERKYNRHYCSLLAPFKRTEASFHFHHRGSALQFDLDKVVLDDLVLPEKFSTEAIPEAFPAYRLDALMTKLDAIGSPIAGAAA